MMVKRLLKRLLKRLTMSDTEKRGEDSPDPQEGTHNGGPMNKPEEKQETDTDQK